MSDGADSLNARCADRLSEAAESALLAVREPCIGTLTEVEFASLIART
jgi:hypothetical protein